MHKCFRCGTQFEGSFCPDCGTQWQEGKRCPSCGATLAEGTKFCPNCGYSFVEGAERKPVKKENKFFKWIKTHLKIVIPSAIALVAVIVVLALIPTFILMSVNGTYYMSLDGEISKDAYITLSTGKWKNDEGMSGRYSISGKNITLKVESQDLGDLGGDFGELEEDLGELEDELGNALGEEFDSLMEMKGTVKNGVLVVNDGFSENIYISESHEHEFDEWKVIKEPTCTAEGEQSHTCYCKKIVKKAIPTVSHKYEWHTTKEVTCTENGEKKNICSICQGTDGSEVIPAKGHNVDSSNRCTVCGDTFKYTAGLVFDKYEDHYVVANYNNSQTTVIIPEYYGGKPVTRIGYNAFHNRSELTSITIPNSVTSIGAGAFEGCSGLTSITIPNSVTSIEDDAFSYCSGLKSITIPNSVTSIGESAFNGCSGLKSITLSNSVTSIKNGAFYGCSGLTSITIPNGVTSIEVSAFFGCSGLTSITIPNSVTSIGGGMLNRCSKLTSIKFGGTKAEWKAIEKGSKWNDNTGNYTVECTDGKLDKDGNEIA